MSKFKVLYTDTGMGDVSIEQKVLEEAGAQMIIASNIDEDTLIREGQDCDGVMVEYAPITARVLEAWGKVGKVKVVSRQGIGYNNVDVKAATANGIMVANVPDYCLDEVADHTMALALSTLREIKSFGKRMANGDFEEHTTAPMHRFSTQNFCLYGFGNIARRVAVRAGSFGFKMYAFDPGVADEMFEMYNVKRVNSLEELADLANVFSIHVPSVDGTRGSVDENILSRLKKGCVFVNTARGDIVDEKALTEALINGRIAGAGLDVFEDEPTYMGNPLLHLDNVVTSPHISWYSEEADAELRMRIAENVILTLTEGKPRSLVNKEVLETKEEGK